MNQDKLMFYIVALAIGSVAGLYLNIFLSHYINTSAQPFVFGSVLMVCNAFALCLFGSIYDPK